MTSALTRDLTDACYAAIGQAFGRNELALIDGAKHGLSSPELGDRRPCLKRLASLWHMLARHDDGLGLVLVGLEGARVRWAMRSDERL
jgi:hypothetical protein